MAGYSDQQLGDVVRPQLQHGEQIWTVAYGERGLPFWAYIVCMLLMIPPITPAGVIVLIVWSLVATKNYIVALTSARLIVVEVSGLKPKTSWSYTAPLQGGAAMSMVGRGLNRAYLLEINAQPPFGVRFLNCSPTNWTNAQNIGATLTRAPVPAPPWGR